LEEGTISAPILSVENLTHVYHPGTPLEKKALEDVSLRVAAGEFLGIVGKTGSGKTTLVQHFNGLLKPSGGKVYVEGRDLEDPGISWPELRRRVGLVFQYPEHQLFAETVFEDIAFVLSQQKAFSPGEIEERVRAACGMVGLDYESFRRRSPFELSGGEMRRAALAGVLVQDPSILILDEPTVGLDGPGKREILRQIGILHRLGKTIVIVSHAVEDLADRVDRLMVMEEGRTLTSGEPGEVFARLVEMKKSSFLVPPVFQLCDDLRAAGWTLPDRVFQTEEALSAIDRILREGRLPPGMEN
jgi:energy-coupling factor transport system ATP-binding protein